MTDSESPTVLSVSQLTSILRGVVEQCFPEVWVAGEVSNCVRAASGHVYFTLQDDQAQLKAVMWRSAAQRATVAMKDGIQVVAQGSLEVYPPRGQYQLVVTQVIDLGQGAREQALRALQQKLSAEGLFDASRKRPLPAIPKTVALVTSPHGAAVHDMLQVLARRWPMARVIIVPVVVQGEQAPASIAAGLAMLSRLPSVDVAVCGRGGGSIEDLWAFNTEQVVRAIAACPVPIVSAVGHEIDTTLADLVADRRALTPTEAAELIVPDQLEMRQQLQQRHRQLQRALERQLQQARWRLDAVAARRSFSRPLERLRDQARRLDDLHAQLRRSIAQKLERAQQQLAQLAARLEALSPLAVLQRGYSLTKRMADGQLVRSTHAVSVGDQLSTLVSDGAILSQVLAVRSDDDRDTAVDHH
jgi:exodeoxyribonuclease VII large subunit